MIAVAPALPSANGWQVQGQGLQLEGGSSIPTWAHILCFPVCPPALLFVSALFQALPMTLQLTSCIKSSSAGTPRRASIFLTEALTDRNKISDDFGPGWSKMTTAIPGISPDMPMFTRKKCGSSCSCLSCDDLCPEI